MVVITHQEEERFTGQEEERLAAMAVTGNENSVSMQIHQPKI